jgi:hypothetical protein
MLFILSDILVLTKYFGLDIAQPRQQQSIINPSVDLDQTLHLPDFQYYKLNNTWGIGVQEEDIYFTVI